MLQRSGEDVLSSAGGKRKHSIYINLTKLQAGTLASLQDDAVAMDTIFPTYYDDQQSKQHTKRPRRKKDAQHRKRKVIKSVRQFFGPVVETTMSPEPQTDGEYTTDSEELPVVNFRLRGMKQSIGVVDPTAELIISRQEAGHEVRLAEANYHRKADSTAKPQIDRKKNLNADKRIFSRVQGTMGLSCLRAVQQAYRDREVAERQTARLEYVIGMKEQREAAKERIKLFQEDRRNMILKERDRDQKRIIDNLEKKDFMQMSTFERGNERKSRSSHFTKQRRSEMTFISDFNVQNTSVSNALMRHDRQAQIEDKNQNRSIQVKTKKQVHIEQQEVVKR